MGGGRISSCGFFVGPTAMLDAPRTYVVLGVPRGGTSMCAGALRMAGVPMGDDITVNGNEDRAFLSHGGDVSLFDRPQDQARYLAQVAAVISGRNRDHSVWGWKDPVSALYLDQVIRDLRNPHLVLIMRDPAAVAMREWTALPQSEIGAASARFYFDHLDRAQRLYARAVCILQDNPVPGLILSYERCLRYPEDFARRILAFSGMGRESEAKRDELGAVIAAYVAADAVSGRLSKSQRDEVLGRALRNDLSFYGSIDDAYSACAGLVNSGAYSDALTLSSSILMSGIDGGRVAPQFVVPPLRFAVIEAGLSFIRAVAFANSAEPSRALMEVLRFTAAREFLARHGSADPLVESLVDPIAGLQDSLTTAIAGPSTMPS